MSAIPKEFAIKALPALQQGFSTASSAAGTAPTSGNGWIWTPGKDSNGVITQTSFNATPAKTFFKLNAPALVSTIDAILTAEYRNTLGRLAESPFVFSGAAGDEINGRMWVRGGGHNAGGNNGTYQFNVFYGTWTIADYPSSSWMRGCSQDDINFFRRKDSQPGVILPGYTFAQYAASGKAVPRMYAYERSSTGYACLVDDTYKTYCYMEAVGPDNTPVPDATTYNAMFLNGNPAVYYYQTWKGFHPQSLHSARYFSLFPDGNPCSNHTYYSLCYSQKRNILTNCGETWRFMRLDGRGWAKWDDPQYPSQYLTDLYVDDAGGTDAIDRTENGWTEEDEVTGKFYSFGYGSEGAGEHDN